MITKKPNNQTNFKRKIYFTNSARQAWGLVLKELNPDDKILLPSYIGVTDREGSGIYDPVISNNIKHNFYLLNGDLTIDINGIEILLKTGNYKLILLVHYFGFFIKNIEEIVSICKKYNVIVVEDCAHLYNFNLYEYSSCGTLGDYAFYSFHKFFPFTEGGMLLQNNLEIKSIVFSQSNSKYSVQLLEYDVNSIVKKRRNNYHLLNSYIAKIPHITPLKEIEDCDIPHNYPIIVKDGLRENLYFWLMERKMPTIALYYKLIKPLRNKKYQKMLDTSSNILNLPIHQDVTESDLLSLVKEVEKFYG